MMLNPPFALFKSATSFANGDDPIWVTETGTRKHALDEGRRRFAEGSVNRELLLCAGNPVPKNPQDTWRMAGFFSGKSKSYRSVTEDQRVKYEGRRRNLFRKSQADVVEPPRPESSLPPQQQPDVMPVYSEQQPIVQEYVLSLDPQTAALFRDAFSLVHQGHSVTIKIKQPEPVTVVEPEQAVVPNPNGSSAPVDSTVG